jgi:cytochrome c oxidase subunit 4
MANLEAKAAHDLSHADDGHRGPDDGNVHVHIGSLGFYVAIFFALIICTLLTVGISDIHLGRLNLIVAVVIASMKASLVVLFFMHLRYDSKFNSMILVMSILFIGVFFAFTMNDTDRRGEIDLEQGVKVLASTGELAPGGEPQTVVVSKEAPATEKSVGEKKK